MSTSPAGSAAPDAVVEIRSRSNPTLVRIRRLLRDGADYRRHGEIWVEGEHLCAAALDAGWVPLQALVSRTAWLDGRWLPLLARVARLAVVDDALHAELSGLDSPADVGFVLRLPESGSFDPALDAVVLDRLQDPGNVGSILRTAAALGVRQVLALKGTVALWSPKVVRAGMGAHFGLRLVEGLAPAALEPLLGHAVVTGSHGGSALNRVHLPSPCAWLFGHEGQGVAPELSSLAALSVRIPQPGGQESLNVAAAAAICLYEMQRQRASREPLPEDQ